MSSKMQIEMGENRKRKLEVFSKRYEKNMSQVVRDAVDDVIEGTEVKE